MAIYTNFTKKIMLPKKANIEAGEVFTLKVKLQVNSNKKLNLISSFTSSIKVFLTKKEIKEERIQ